MIIKNLINRSFQAVCRLSFRNTQSIVKQNLNSKQTPFSSKLKSKNQNQSHEQPNKPQKNVAAQPKNKAKLLNSLSQRTKKLQQQRTKQNAENNPFSSVDLNENNMNQIGEDNVKLLDSCNQNIIEKKYSEAAEDLQEILDNLEEQKAHSEALQLLELQTSLYLYSRKYLDAYLVRSNITKYMEYAPQNYDQSEIQEQVIKLYYQLLFTHTFKAENDLDILYKNHYRNFTSENKALFDIAIAVSHFISPDKEAQAKGVNSILNCIKNTKNIELQSQALYNLSVYQQKLYENPKQFMELILQNEQTNETMKKGIQQTLNKLKLGEKLLSSDISNPLQNILVSLNLNSFKIPIFSISDIIKHKENLILCDKFCLKSLLFLAQNYNLFNIQTNKSLRLQLMHFAYEVSMKRQQHQKKANFLYASLFADLKKVQEAKQLLFKNLKDKTDPLQDPIRYETYMLLSLIDFENKYQYKKQAQEVITKDNLQYWATQIDQYDIQAIHMLTEDKLVIVDNEDMEELQSMINESNNISEDEDDEQDSDLSGSEDEEGDEEMDEQKLSRLENDLKQMEQQLEQMKNNYFMK